MSQIISSNKKGRRYRSSGIPTARTRVLGNTAVTSVQRVRVAATSATDAAKVVTQGSEKIIVSNLPGDVNEAQVKVCQRYLPDILFSVI